MIFKYLAVMLISIVLFSGCTIKEYVYVKDACPSIQVLKVVPKISGKPDANGCVCGDQLDNLLKGASQLRKSETYYGAEVNKYNIEFAIPKEELDK